MCCKYNYELDEKDQARKQIYEELECIKHEALQKQP